jgi:hypothetical protein
VGEDVLQAVGELERVHVVQAVLETKVGFFIKGSKKYCMKYYRFLRVFHIGMIFNA